MTSRTLTILLAAAALLAVPAAASAGSYEATTRYYGGNANYLTNSEASLYSIDALKRTSRWIDGGYIAAIARPDFKRAYVRVKMPLTQCVYLRRDPWSVWTNYNTSTFVGIWSYKGIPCSYGP